MKHLALAFLLASPVYAQRDFMRSYDGINDLLEANPGGAHDTAFISYLLTPGDGGSGILKYDPSDVTATNANDIFKPVSFNGRWTRITNNLGLGTIASQNANSVTITGGSITGITDLSLADGGTGGSDARSASKNLTVPQYVDINSLSSIAGSTMPLSIIATNINYQGELFWSPDGATRPLWDSWLDGSSSYGGIAIRDSANLGYFLRKIEGPLNVMWFGAVGDGVTDDTAALQTAIDFVRYTTYNPEYAGDTWELYCPKGRYRIDGTVSSVYTSADGAKRNATPLTISGDGPHASVFFTDRTDWTPMFYFREHKYISGKHIGFFGKNYEPADVHSTEPYTDGIGLWLWDSIEGDWQDIRFEGLGVGAVVYCREGGMIRMQGRMRKVGLGFLGDGVQTGDYEFAFRESGMGVFAHGATGSRFRIALMEEMGNEWQEDSGFRLTGGSSPKIDLGYLEGNENKMVSLGESLVYTNSADCYYSGGLLYFPLGQYHTMRYDPDNTNGLSTIQTWVGSTNTDLTNLVNAEFSLATNIAVPFTNLVCFDPGVTITSSLAGVTFTIQETTAAIEMDNPWVTGPRSDITGTGFWLDKVNGFQWQNAYINSTNLLTHIHWTTNTINPDFSRVMGSDLTAYTGEIFKQPVNIWADPEFRAGTNQLLHNGTWRFRANATKSTEYSHGDGGSLKVYGYYLNSTEASSANGWVRLTIPGIGSADVGKRISASCSVFAPDIEAYRPSSFTIVNPGSGYTNGQATMTDGTKTITVTLTTSAGLITGITWFYGYFVTSDTSTAFTITQTGGSGGTARVATYINDGYGIGSFPLYYVRLRSSNGTEIKLHGESETPDRRSAEEASMWHHHYGTGIIPTGATSMQLYVLVYGANSKISGAEAIYLDDLVITLDDDVNQYTKERQMWKMDVQGDQAGRLKYSEGSPEGVVLGFVGDICVDTVSGASYVKESGDYTNTGWSLIKTVDNSTTLTELVDNTTVYSKTLTDRAVNGSFTGSATGWDLSGGWAYSANNIVLSGTVITDAIASMAITNILAGEEYDVTADLTGFAASEEITVQVYFDDDHIVTLDAGITAPIAYSTSFTVPDLDVGTTSGFLQFIGNNVSGAAGVTLDNVTMTLTKGIMRQAPMDTYWPAGSLTQVGDYVEAEWIGGVDANTPDIGLVIRDSVGNEGTLWSFTTPGTGDFELKVRALYNGTASLKWSMFFNQSGQVPQVDHGTSTIATLASEGFSLKFRSTPDADNDVNIQSSIYRKVTQ